MGKFIQPIVRDLLSNISIEGTFLKDFQVILKPLLEEMFPRYYIILIYLAGSNHVPKGLNRKTVWNQKLRVNLSFFIIASFERITSGTLF